MSVITNKYDMAANLTDHCTFCGGHLFYPFIEYHVASEDPKEETPIVTICRRCCRECGEGLQADLIQVMAIDKLETLYPGFTLVRKTRAQVGRQHEYEEREGQKILAQIRRNKVL